MKAIIMAGGEGTRLRPLTCNRPKPMIPVINRPVIEHAVNLLKKYNITDITISLFYLPENIQNYFGDGSEWDVNIRYSVEETPLGTAGGVKQAAGIADDTIIVLSGDGIIDFDLNNIIDFHRGKKSPFTIVLNHVKKPTDYGIVITDENSRIEKFLEKPSWSEVFTDTANTGMYVIEPEIINNHIPGSVKYDFSLDLFPLLQEKDVPLYGYTADGYWCDVGNLISYGDVHREILDGLVKIDLPGKKIAKDIWVGKDFDIHPEAVITGPAYIGNFVKIKKGVEISEATVIGDNCIIEENASVKRSIILHSTIIGPKCELRGAIIGKRCVLEEGVSIYEGAVTSDDCRIGMGVEIPAGIRVWPDKMIEQGTRLTTDLIWGQQEKKTVFSTEGVVGTFNVKITPEFSSKLGSAIGAFLGKNAKVIVSRDPTSAARLIQHAFEAGILSMGVDVYDMEIESVPINRYSTRFINADMGIYIQISPLTGLQFIQIRLFDKYGFQLSLKDEKKIENIFFRGDYPRKDAFETGKLIYPTHNIQSYISNIKNYINAEILRNRKWKVIVDCFNGTASHVFPDLLDSFGCETTILRGQIKEFNSEENTRFETRKALRNIIKMSRINREIGVILGPHGTQLTVIDEMGNILTGDNISAMLCLYYIKYKNEKIINIPVTTSRVIEKIIIENGGTANRISSKMRAPDGMTDIFLADESGRYPYLEQIFDPMITFLRILKFLTLENVSLHEIKERLPASNIINTSLHCTMDEKALIMRMLTTDSAGREIEMIDGIKITENNAWVLILPDAAQPLVHLYAEGETSTDRDRIIEEYTVKIKKFKNTIQ